MDATFITANLEKTEHADSAKQLATTYRGRHIKACQLSNINEQTYSSFVRLQAWNQS
jgi:hypothetical protein